jgi:cytochrome o ubiquinol oxidase operon protein cyoD
MSTDHAETSPLSHPEVQQASFVGYIAGFSATLALLAAGLLLTVEHSLPPMTLLGTISVLALAALLAQCVMSFGLNIARHNIWKSVSLILTIPLFILTIGLTVWMFQQLDALTMIPGSGVMPGMTTQPTLLQ